MKRLIIVLLFLISLAGFSQTEIHKSYQIAENFLKEKKLHEAYSILKDIEPKCDKEDTIYSYILWYYAGIAAELENQYRMAEKFDSSVYYGLEALKLIDKGKPLFNEVFALREYWMNKNLIVSYFGLGQLDNAKKHKDFLYSAYKSKSLPEGINKHFNFNYFKWEGKNIWGYEWYPELGDPETEGSFSKIVYYVYSTNPDGSDKDQLYRLHVLKFHKIDPTISFDYVLTKRLEKATNEVSGTFYAYTYKKEIDYTKLQQDIREVLKGNYEPDTKTILKKGVN